ncbi:hypothetical protein BsWGS_20285 [Bradybaena similaris]
MTANDLRIAEKTTQPVVSVILPVHNAAKWLHECLTSVQQQSYKGPLEISIYDDASTDASRDIIDSWQNSVQHGDSSFTVIISGHTGSPKGVGFAKNRAIDQSSGQYLCFLDADDVMHRDRIKYQLQATQMDSNAIVGCKFHREPAGSTERYTQWANTLTSEQLYTQVYTSFGPTVIMPTWFCHRQVFDAVGAFDETGKGTPEDLLFFYGHLERGGSVLRVEKDLLMYRYHPEAETFSISEATIWKHRVTFLEKQILNNWKHFSIWNAGKQGRKLYRSLSAWNKNKVSMFCDVDDKKIHKGYYIYEESQEKPKPKVPVVHFTQVKPPVVICVKMNLSGNFEQNLKSLHLKEGRDFVHFN